MDLKTADQPRWMVVATGVVGAAATVLSIYTSVAAEALKRETASLDARLRVLDDERKDLDQRTNLRIKLFDKVDTTLAAIAEKPRDDEYRRKRYRAATALVGGMKTYVRDDSFIGGLMQALEFDAQSTPAQEDIREIKFDAEISDHEAPPPNVKNSRNPPLSQSLQRVDTQSASLFTQALAQGTNELNLNGISVDVFYCTKVSDDAGNAARRGTARILYDALLAIPTRGRLRLRELPQTVNERPAYQIRGNQVRFDKGEEQAPGQLLAAWAGVVTKGPAFQAITVTAAPTPGYLSMFICVQ
jgi:hypothetical protein